MKILRVEETRRGRSASRIADAQDAVYNAKTIPERVAANRELALAHAYDNEVAGDRMPDRRGE